MNCQCAIMMAASAPRVGPGMNAVVGAGRGVDLYATERNVRQHIARVSRCRSAGLGWRMVQSSVRVSDREAGGTAHTSGARQRVRGGAASDNEEEERPRALSPPRHGDYGESFHTITTGYPVYIQWTQKHIQWILNSQFSAMCTS